MTWIDAAALILVVLSAAFSTVRGFVREVLGVAAWLGAAFCAVRFYPLIMSQIASVVPKGAVVYVSMFVVFLVVLIVLSMVSALVGGLVRDSALSGLDRSLGMVFGLARGAAIVCLAYVALSVGVAQDQWPAAVVNARFLPWAHAGAAAIIGYLPHDYQPKVDPLPNAPPPTAASLMQQPVAGSAMTTQ